MTPVTKGYVDITGGQVHYLCAGPQDGTPLVLLHATSDAASMWEPALPVFGRLGYRAVAFDIPGHGNSFRPESEPGANGYAAMMHEAVRAFGLERYHLLGHHFGGTVAGILAADHPNSVRTLSVFGWNKIGGEWIKSIRAAKPREFGADGETVRHHWVRRWEMSGRLLDDPAENRFSEALGLRTMIALLQAGKEWFWAYRAIGETDHAVLAGRIGCPVLLFAGPRDHLWQESQDGVADFANARFVGMDWVGVDAVDEEPDLFCAVVDRFIRAENP